MTATDAQKKWFAEADLDDKESKKGIVINDANTIM